MLREFLEFHFGEAIHLLDSHALIDVAYAFLQGQQLFVGHDVWVDLFAEEIGPLFCHVELVHSHVVGHHWVELISKHLS